MPFFFQITSKYPKKLISDSAAASFKTGDIIISTLSLAPCDADLDYYLVGDCKTPDMGKVLSWGELCERTDVIRRCRPQSTLFYTVRNISGHNAVKISGTVAALMESQALESTMSDMCLSIQSGDAAHVDTLEFLRSHGVVERLAATPDSSSWRLTLAGEDLIEPRIKMHPDDSELVVVPRTDIEISSMTQFELIHFLQAAGWKSFVWYPTAQASRPPPVLVENGGPKIWYVKQNSICISKPYLVALASLDNVNSDVVEHFRQDKYYRGLLKIKKMSFRSDEVGVDFELLGKGSRKRVTAKTKPSAATSSKQTLDENDEDKQPAKARKGVGRSSHPKSYWWSLNHKES